MGVFLDVVIVAISDLAAALVEQGQHRIERRAIARGGDVEGQRLPSVGLETEEVGVFGIGGAVDQDRVGDGLRQPGAVVWLRFVNFR